MSMHCLRMKSQKDHWRLNFINRLINANCGRRGDLVERPNTAHAVPGVRVKWGFTLAFIAFHKARGQKTHPSVLLTLHVPFRHILRLDRNRRNSQPLSWLWVGERNTKFCTVLRQ